MYLPLGIILEKQVKTTEEQEEKQRKGIEDQEEKAIFLT